MCRLTLPTRQLLNQSDQVALPSENEHIHLHYQSQFWVKTASRSNSQHGTHSLVLTEEVKASVSARGAEDNYSFQQLSTVHCLKLNRKWHLQSQGRKFPFSINKTQLFDMQLIEDRDLEIQRCTLSLCKLKRI